MTDLDLYQQRQEMVQKMHLALKECALRGEEWAKAEREYKVAMAQYILTARANGTPATLIKDLAMGDDNVSALRFNRDIALTAYENAKEARNIYKLNIRLIESDIAREWGLAKDE
nr:MAG TPA: hypothetical protein [Caudoviricetes sp.]